MTRLVAGLRLFWRKETGSIAVETIIILPILFWCYMGLFSFFHAFRTYATNQKAAYTIADMVSRQTDPIDRAFLQGSEDLFVFLTKARDQDVSIRLTLVRRDIDTGRPARDWSQSTGSVMEATASDVRGWETLLPDLSLGDRLIVVETFMDYDPPFETGLTRRQVSNFIFTKPRFSPQILWDG